MSRPEHPPAGADQDDVYEAWSEHVEASSEQFKADHPDWFVA